MSATKKSEKYMVLLVGDGERMDRGIEVKAISDVSESDLPALYTGLDRREHINKRRRRQHIHAHLPALYTGLDRTKKNGFFR